MRGRGRQTEGLGCSVWQSGKDKQTERVRRVRNEGRNGKEDVG